MGRETLLHARSNRFERARHEDLAARPSVERRPSGSRLSRSGGPPIRATIRKSPEAKREGRPLSSVTSRVRRGSTAETPGVARRNGTTSSGRSPTSPRLRPAAALIQRSERSVDSTQTRTVSRIEETVTIMASVIPRAIASAATAMPLRASDPPKEPAASRPAAPTRETQLFHRRANASGVGRLNDGNDRAVTEAAPSIGPSAMLRPAAKRRGSGQAPARRLSRFSTNPQAGEGATRDASAAGRRGQEELDATGAFESRRVSGSGIWQSADRCWRRCWRRRREQRGPGTRRPLLRESCRRRDRKSLGHEDREDRATRCPERLEGRDLRTPQDRYRDRWRPRKTPTRSVREPSALIEAKGATIRSPSPRLPGGWSEPRRKTRESLPPSSPRDSWLEDDVHAVDDPRPSQKLLRGEDVGARVPPAARATPVSSSRPAIATGGARRRDDREMVSHRESMTPGERLADEDRVSGQRAWR